MVITTPLRETSSRTLQEVGAAPRGEAPERLYRDHARLRQVICAADSAKCWFAPDWWQLVHPSDRFFIHAGSNDLIRLLQGVASDEIRDQIVESATANVTSLPSRPEQCAWFAPVCRSDLDAAPDVLEQSVFGGVQRGGFCPFLPQFWPWQSRERRASHGMAPVAEELTELAESAPLTNHQIPALELS